MDEFVEAGTSIPSGALKEEILALLASNKNSVEVLANVLQINPVNELVSNYEECHGQVSLDTWRYVLQQLGYYKEHFQQLVLADQMIADAKDIGGIDDLEENNCGAQSIRRDWPEWSLPPPLPRPDESLVKENVVEDAAKGDDDENLSMQAASEKVPSFENNKFSSAVQSLSQGKSSTLGLVPAVENGRSQHENSALAVIEGREEKLAASSVQADYKQQSIDKTMTPSRPTTPESPRSTHDPVVTGQKRSRQNNADAEAHPPGNGEQDLDCSNQESDNPYKTPTENDCMAENDWTENNNGLYAELQNANESLQQDVSFLVEELRKKNLDCAWLQNKCNGLQQQFEECRGQCTQLQIINEEFERCLEESAELVTESQQLIRMTQEVCIWREQENNRLEEHIRQLDERYDNANCCMEDLRREHQQMSEELRLAFNQMLDLQGRDHNLERKHEHLRLQYEERVAGAAQTFNNAETDKVKRLKQKLAQEKSRRKILLEENHRLTALVKDLRSKEEGHFPSGGSGEDDARENAESSSAASSEVEDDEQSGSSSPTQQSDSGSSREDDRLEDASADATAS